MQSREKQLSVMMFHKVEICMQNFYYTVYFIKQRINSSWIERALCKSQWVLNNVEGALARIRRFYVCLSKIWGI